MPTKLRSVPMGESKEMPKGAPNRLAMGRLIWGKPVNPEMHNMRMALLR